MKKQRERRPRVASNQLATPPVVLTCKSTVETKCTITVYLEEEGDRVANLVHSHLLYSKVAIQRYRKEELKDVAQSILDKNVMIWK